MADDRGNARILLQDFVPGVETSETRRPLRAVPENTVVESFGISPDGQRFTISTMRQVSVLNLAEGLGRLR